MRLFAGLLPVQGSSGVIGHVAMGALLSLPLEGLSLLLLLFHLKFALSSLWFRHFSPPGMLLPLFQMLHIPLLFDVPPPHNPMFDFVLCLDSFPLWAIIKPDSPPYCAHIFVDPKHLMVR